MKLAAYVRVSTENQVDAFGKEVQTDLIERYAQLGGHEIVVWYEEDAVSGKVEGASRPVFHEMLMDYEDNTSAFAGVIALDSSRFARDLLVQETLFQALWSKGLEIFCANGGQIDKDDETDPTRKFTRRLFGLIAELERDTVYMRLHGGRRRKMAKGGYGGGIVKYGYCVENGEIVPCADEQVVIQSIYDMRDTGLSYKKISHRLNAAGVYTKTGLEWRERQISRILQERG